MIITRRSIISDRSNTLDVPITLEQYTRWQSGELIQNVMPELSAELREFLISGMTPEEQEAFYGGDDEFGDDEE